MVLLIRKLANLMPKKVHILPLSGEGAQRVLGLTWRPQRMNFFVSQKPVEISKNDSNTNSTPLKVM